MGQKPRDLRTEPSLELPSLFRRRKRARAARRDAPDETAGQPTAEPEAVEPQVAEPAPEPVDQPIADPNPQRLAGPAPQRVTEPEPEPVRGEYADPDGRPPAGPADRPPSRSRRAEAKKRRPRRVIPGALAALIAGVVVGGFGTGSTYGALRGCEALNGTSSCGGPGIFGLLAIVVLMGLVGALLLRLLRVPDAGSTSFLGVGLLCVVVLVALMEELFSVWMFVAIPLLSAACYWLARWVTTRFVQPYEKAPGPDVR